MLTSFQRVYVGKYHAYLSGVEVNKSSFQSLRAS